MYENGRRIEGYRKKRLHKRKQKNTYAKTWSYGDRESGMDWTALKIYAFNRAKTRYGSDADYTLDYWKYYNSSKQRTAAKRETARRARQQFRERVNTCADWEEFEGLDPYKKIFDYDWEVW